jgi:molybdopterin-containing oxidoreductase family membrane subunit
MYSPTIWDWGMFLGTIGFFIANFFLFVRLLPMIAMFEMRLLVPKSGVTGKESPPDDHAHGSPAPAMHDHANRS